MNIIIKKKGPYKILYSETIYKDPWITLQKDEVIKPDGSKGAFAIIDYGKGVSIAALNNKKEIYLVKEYYYAIGEYGVQLPSGGIEKKETPLDAAKRELLEETGIVASEWIELGLTHPLTMLLNSPAFLYLALNVSEVNKQEKGIEVIKVPFEKAYEMVVKSEINHAQSCITIMKAKIYLETH